MKNLVVIFIFSVLGFNASGQSNIFFEKCDQFLKKNVSEGKVNYSSIQQDQTDLDELINIIETNSWTKDQEKAYLINVYNIQVINKIVDNYPISSPMDVNSFFEKKDLHLNGEKISLNDLENKRLRPTYNDPRFHFSLVCGAISCPILRSEAYLPELLDKQLEEQTSIALNNTEFVWQDASYDATYVSEIFYWYKDDFGGDEQGIFDYINQYSKDPFRDDFPMESYPYSWNLNELKHISGPRIETTEVINDSIDVSPAPLNKNDDFNLQTFTAGSLLAKGKFDFTLFNTLYTEDHKVWNGNSFSGYRATFVTHLFQLTYGITKSKRINVGIDFNLKNNGGSVDSTFSGVKSAFSYSNTDSTRFGLTSIGARIKIQPFKKVKNFSIQSTLQIPTVKFAEGRYVDSATHVDSRYWADWDRITWWNQFFMDKTWGKIQLFAEIDLLFRLKKYKTQDNALDTPISLFFSYFPTSKITVYVMSQHVARFIGKSKDPFSDWIAPANYTTSGLGFKYNIARGLNIELLYTNFWRGTNTGLGSTYNIGLKYVMN